METGHTPGPWKAHSFSHGLKDVPVSSETRDVARVLDCAGPELVSNARLIAAAPDLLAALIDILGDLGGRPGVMHLPSIHAGRDAIAKAGQ
jgi:hypothetical protein